MFRWMLAMTVALFVWSGHPTAAEPTVELKIKAIKDMLPLAEYLGDLAGQGEQAEQGAKFVEAMAGKKGIIEGIDITRPIGFYATMTPAVIDSPLVVLVPIGDETAFLNLLRTKLNLNPEKGDGDIYAVDIPNVPPKVYFTFHKGYVCVTVHNRDTLDAKSLLDPKDFFAKSDSALVSLAVHLERIPAEVRKTVLGQLELKLADEKAKPAKTPAEEKAKALVLDSVLAGAAALLNEGRTASLKFNIEPKTDDISLEFELTAKPSSDLKSLFTSSAGRKAVAPLAASKDAVVSVAMNLQVPEAMKKKYDAMVDLAIAEGLENAKGNDRDVAKRVFEAIEPSLKAGVLELGASLIPVSSGKHQLLAAVRMKSGKEIEKLVKEFAPFIPEGQGRIAFDVDKVGTAAVHEVTLPANDVTDKMFGKSHLWMAISDDLLVAGYAPDSTATKKLVSTPAGVTPIVGIEISWARLAPLTEPQRNPEFFKVLNQEVFANGNPSGKDTMKLAVTGGDNLKVQFSIKGRAAKYLALLQKKKADS